MAKEEKYPSSWLRAADGGWESDERLDGRPDFIITRHKVRDEDGRPHVRWYLKVRTSAGGDWFDSASDAKTYAENIRWVNR